MTHFYIGLFHNSKKKKKKKTFIGNRSRDFQYDVGKKYAPNRANWVQKFKISLRKGALPPGPPPGGQPPGTPVIGQQFGPPPFPAAGSAPVQANWLVSEVGCWLLWHLSEVVFHFKLSEHLFSVLITINKLLQTKLFLEFSFIMFWYKS